MAYLLSQGRSWSGNERNVCFLNTGDGRFADISTLSGFDYSDDARAIGLTDWDHDGDVDLWVSNRNAPRIRMLQNVGHPQHHFFAIQLIGTRCNRDAIGARVDLFVDELPAKPLVRCVHAGSGYLSQSSKWLYFGLGKAKSIQRIVVRWPDGEVQELPPLDFDQHYRLVQGQTTPEVWSREVAANAIQPAPATIVQHR